MYACLKSDFNLPLLVRLEHHSSYLLYTTTTTAANNEKERERPRGPEPVKVYVSALLILQWEKSARIILTLFAKETRQLVITARSFKLPFLFAFFQFFTEKKGRLDNIPAVN